MSRAVGLLLLMAVAWLTWARPSFGEEPPSLHEFIVKFKPGTAGDDAALQAMQDQAGQSRLFGDLAAALSREIGIPQRIKSVTSGRELVIAVDADAAASAALARLARWPGVVRAAILAPGEMPQVMPRSPVISVEFAAGSPISRSLGQAWPAQPAAVPELRDLIDAVAGETGIALVPQAPAVLFALDLAALSRLLGRRLQAREDVDYLQPVTLLQPQ